MADWRTTCSTCVFVLFLRYTCLLYCRSLILKQLPTLLWVHCCLSSHHVVDVETCHLYVQCRAQPILRQANEALAQPILRQAIEALLDQMNHEENGSGTKTIFSWTKMTNQERDTVGFLRDQDDKSGKRHSRVFVRRILQLTLWTDRKKIDYSPNTQPLMRILCYSETSNCLCFEEEVRHSKGHKSDFWRACKLIIYERNCNATCGHVLFKLTIYHEVMSAK